MSQTGHDVLKDALSAMDSYRRNGMTNFYGFRVSALPFGRGLASIVLASILSFGLAACGESEPAKKAENPAPPAVAASNTPSSLLNAGPLGDKVLGKPDAPVTIVEYASFTCSHCADFHLNSFKALKEKYIDTGKVRFIFREFPLDPLSTAASMMARCAPDQRYFPLADMLFSQQREWAGSDKPLDDLLAIARQAGFTQESFEACLKNQAIYDGINAAKRAGVDQHGVNSTPTFFINGQKKVGNTTIEAFDALIEPLLAK
jgi:protein-disulfide isomerase